jgi:peroxiredoxin
LQKAKIARLILALIIVSVSLTILALGERSYWGKLLEVGDRVPQFSVRLTDGRQISPQSFLGKRYLIVFFRPNCAYCEAELPWIAHARPEGTEPTVFAVSTGNPEAISRFWLALDTHLPTAVDRDRVVAKAFRVRRVPTLVSIGRDGRIDLVRVGLISRVDLARILRGIGAPPMGSFRESVFGGNACASCTVSSTSLSGSTEGPER